MAILMQLELLHDLEHALKQMNLAHWDVIGMIPISCLLLAMLVVPL